MTYTVQAVTAETGFVCRGEDIVVAYKVSVLDYNDGYFEVIGKFIGKFNANLNVHPSVELVLYPDGARIEGLDIGTVFVSRDGRVSPKVTREGVNPTSLRSLITAGKAPEQAFILATMSQHISKALTAHFSHPRNSRAKG